MKDFSIILAVLKGKKCQLYNTKMFLIAFPVFVLCFIAGGLQCGALMETPPVNNTSIWHCKEWETECLLGCCPLENGVCCIDGFECCPEGTTCIPFVGLCLRAVSDNGQTSLESEKSVVLRSSVLKCPPNMTECAPNMCCPYKNGTCCDDGKHCCPNGYTCDLTNMKCIPQTKETSFEKPLRRMSAKSTHTSCPGGNRMCPGYMSCCVNDNGDWGCCPKPSVHEIQYGGGECCDSIFGYMCCPDVFSTCSIFGCTK